MPSKFLQSELILGVNRLISLRPLTHRPGHFTSPVRDPLAPPQGDPGGPPGKGGRRRGADGGGTNTMEGQLRGDRGPGVPAPSPARPQHPAGGGAEGPGGGLHSRALATGQTGGRAGVGAAVERLPRAHQGGG